MCKHVLITTILIFCYFINQGLAQEIVELTFTDNFYPSSNQSLNIPALPKAKRTNCNASSIIINGGDDFEDEQLKKVVDYVVSVWQSHILNSIDLYVTLELADINTDIETVVKYIRKDDIAYPTALYAYINQMKDRGSSPYPDGIILINRNTKWDYAIGDNIISDRNNLAFGLMRAFARILGFGSDVQKDDKGNYSFAEKRYHTVFNTLISNSNGDKLSDIAKNGGKPSQPLKSFIEELKQTFWVNVNNQKYQLASAPYSQENPPFVYLEDVYSLMRKNATTGSYVLHIDDSTHDILRGLGWNTLTPTVTIQSDDIPASGIASAYEQHRFRINKGNLSITNAKWMLKLPLKDGSYKSIPFVDEGFACTIPPLSEISEYKRNADGDIAAVLELEYQINGSSVKAMPFKINYELAPYIDYAVIERIEDETPYPSYNAYYKVKYRGADNIKVYVEEEFGGKIKLTRINEPYIITGCAEHIKAPYYAWIDFEVENSYGKATYTIELQPYGKTTTQVMGKRRNTYGTDMFNTKLEKDTLKMDVYDSQGNWITQINNLSEVYQIKNKSSIHERQAALLKKKRREG